jgi:predicted acetyltransferase
MSYHLPAADEIEQQIALLGHSFGAGIEDERRWHAAIGAEHHRVLTAPGASGAERVVATGAWVPFGLMLGGREVPVWGVSGVAVDPTVRGRGHGRTLIEAMNAEAHAAGQAMTVLYASAPAFYRATGYAAAGHLLRYRAHLSSIGAISWPDDVDLVPLDGRERAPLVDLRARAEPLGLVGARRGAFLWHRALDRWMPGLRIALVRQAGEPIGYLAIKTDGKSLHLADYCALVPVAARAILACLRDHSVVQSTLLWTGLPVDPLADDMAQSQWSIDDGEFWYARVLDPAKALAHRGYRPAARGTISLAASVSPQAPPVGLRLSIEGGRADVAAIGPEEAELQVNHAGLAPLITGFLSPSRLAAEGRLTGPQAAIDRADILFAGEPPFLVDYF